MLEKQDRYRAKALNPQLPLALDLLAELGFLRQDKGYVGADGKRWQQRCGRGRSWRHCALSMS